MEAKENIKDLVIPLSDYPHMPYWGTIREAIVQLNVARETGHNTILVFDEVYKLVGVLSQKDILKGLLPKFTQHYEDGVPIFWNELLKTGSEKQLASPIKEYMSGVKATIDAEESILKASHIMLREDTYLLPVMERENLIGVLRMDELFHDITSTVLNL